MKRQRGRGRRSNGANNNPNRHFESTGPDVKIRGSAQQILDKYLQYARDAQSSGDRISAENYFQHAEHYARVLATLQPKPQPRREGAEDQEGGEAAEASEQGETPEGEAKPNGDGRRGRRPREAAPEPAETEGADPLKVIDADEAPAEAEADAPAEDSGEKRKPRRRRTYKSQDADAPAEPDAETGGGLMATLSRGRPADADEGDAPAADDAAEAEPTG